MNVQEIELWGKTFLRVETPLEEFPGMLSYLSMSDIKTKYVFMLHYAKDGKVVYLYSPRSFRPTLSQRRSLLPSLTGIEILEYFWHLDCTLTLDEEAKLDATIEYYSSPAYKVRRMGRRTVRSIHPRFRRTRHIGTHRYILIARAAGY